MYFIQCRFTWLSPRTAPGPGIRPTPASGVPNFAVSSATTMSHTMVSSQPPPSAWPWTAAITGLGSSSHARKPLSASRMYSRRAATPPGMLPKSSMSPPTEKRLAGAVHDDHPDVACWPSASSAVSRSSL